MAFARVQFAIGHLVHPSIPNFTVTGVMLYSFGHQYLRLDFIFGIALRFFIAGFFLGGLPLFDP
tara:strand:- start:185 stop:376 length:192 start_codon:yes stop_codon:yes gene_type:complete